MMLQSRITGKRKSVLEKSRKVVKMSDSEKLKNAILHHSESIRAFAREADIPHGTLVSALNNGIEGMAWSKMKKICDVLQLDPMTLEPILTERDVDSEQEERLLAYYNRLNHKGKGKVEEYIKDMCEIAEYHT